MPFYKEAFAVRIWLTQARYLNASLEWHSIFIRLDLKAISNLPDSKAAVGALTRFCFFFVADF